MTAVQFIRYNFYVVRQSGWLILRILWMIQRSDENISLSGSGSLSGNILQRMSRHTVVTVNSDNNNNNNNIRLLKLSNRN